MSLDENIKNRREELKLSQEYVAERLGVSRQAVSKWETGQSEPTASNLIQLTEVLEISLPELVDSHKNDQSVSEKEQHRKNPNPILRANLIKIAIIAQAACVTSASLWATSPTTTRMHSMMHNSDWRNDKNATSGGIVSMPPLGIATAKF